MEGSENIVGLKSPAVDFLIKKVLDANSQAELEVAAHALDRVLIHGHYVIPWRYLKKHYLLYNRALQHPKTLPAYYSATEWAIQYWWHTPQAGAAKPLV